MRGIVSNSAGYFLWKFTHFVVQLVAAGETENCTHIVKISVINFTNIGKYGFGAI